MAFQFEPLDLRHAGTLGQETKAVLAAYEQVLTDGDAGALAALRDSVERRIDDLEAFYTQHVDDERSVLFERQRLKLRKLLHEFDGAAAEAAAAAAAAVGVSGAASASAGVTTKTIHENSRLALHELQAWLAQAGTEEMPDVTPDVVAAVFAAVTRTNRDGAMSIRDLRQWYITFGRHALASGSAGSGLSAGGELAGGIVAPAMAGAAGSAALAKTRSFRTGGGRGAAAAAGGGGGSSGGVPLTPAALLGGPAAANTAVPTRPLYAWEHGPAAATAAGSVGGPGAAAPPLALPHGMVEFQVRLTPGEHAAVQLRRRMAEAEARYTARVAEAAARAAARHGGDGGAGGGSGAESTVRDTPYVDPTADVNAYFLRSD